MENVGIVCEYNPFHSGHKHQISLLREGGAKCIICVMSGNFTQRGEPAIADKYTRAKMAISEGADIVLELPFPYCSLSAEGFSRAGVYILSALGADTLSFGCECGSVSKLTHAAGIISGKEFQERFAELQKSVCGSTSAFFEAYKSVTGENADFSSNDILGISYIRAISELESNMTPHAILRTGNAYNDNILKSGYPSATAIRESLSSSGADKLENYIPSCALDCLECAIDNKDAPVFAQTMREHVLMFFRLNSPEEISMRATSLCSGSEIPDNGDGIVNRLCSIAKSAVDADDFYAQIYNSKHTDSRIRRVILYSLLGVSDGVKDMLPPYTLLLGATETGRNYLSKVRKNSNIPIITKPADIPESKIKLLTQRADSLYAQLMPRKISGDYFAKKSPFII
ncbi:MAG: nucleotidyltransferase family protein [Ruminococcaceae bacterium]|nr:nucleotidyltransferase family protein [Oscillospiraceae bacterium]